MKAPELIRAITIALVLSQMTGCILFRNDTRNVSSKPEFWGGTRVGEEYLLKSDVFLCESYGSTKYSIAPPSSEYDSVPSSVEEFRNNPDRRWFPPIIDVINRGTRLRIVKLEWWKTLKGNWGVSTLAVIADEQPTDRKILIDDLLEHPDPTRAGLPVPELLERSRAAPETVQRVGWVE